MKVYRPTPPPPKVLAEFAKTAKRKHAAEQKLAELLRDDPKMKDRKTIAACSALYRAKADMRVAQVAVDDASPLYWERREQPVNVVTTNAGVPFPVVIEFPDGYRGIAEEASIVDFGPGAEF